MAEKNEQQPVRWSDVLGTWEQAAGRWSGATGDDVHIVERIGEGLCLTIVHVAEDGARSARSSAFPDAESLLAHLMPGGRPLALIDLPDEEEDA